jgi:hypothetical protein
MILLFLFQFNINFAYGELTTLEKAKQIEQALLMSKLLVLGYLSALMNDMTLSTLVDKEAEACIKQKGEKVVGHAFATTIDEIFSDSIINEGFNKANKLAINKANTYILNNIDSLSREYKNSNTEYKATEYYLLAALNKHSFTNSEKEDVREFVFWHQNAGFDDFSNHWRLDYSLIKSDLLHILQHCTQQ